jgi:hypothetical protein
MSLLYTHKARAAAGYLKASTLIVRSRSPAATSAPRPRGPIAHDRALEEIRHPSVGGVGKAVCLETALSRLTSAPTGSSARADATLPHGARLVRLGGHRHAPPRARHGRQVGAGRSALPRRACRGRRIGLLPVRRPGRVRHHSLPLPEKPLSSLQPHTGISLSTFGARARHRRCAAFSGSGQCGAFAALVHGKPLPPGVLAWGALFSAPPLLYALGWTLTAIWAR